MAFRDMAFCSAACANLDCPRQFTAEQSKAAEKWWGGQGAPVAFSDFSARCGEHVPPDPEDGR